LFVFFIQLNAQTNQCDSLFVQFIGEKENDFEFEIINNSKDTLYLFDSYLFDRDERIIGTYLDGKEMQRSKYLHRYDKKTKQCKLSFLPLLPFLSVRHNDLIVLGGNKVAHIGQVLYHFRLIPPNSKNAIVISKSAFYSEDYVKEVYPQKISKFDTIKFRKSKHTKCDTVIVEFALYKNIDLLNSKDAYYFDEFNFNEQALSYIVLSVSVNLSRPIEIENKILDELKNRPNQK
jgi:hypothetical protein